MTTHPPILPSRHATRGFSLIEALVTLVLIGLGVLAAAGLQIGARKGQQEAAQRTVASAAVQDLVERMRGNNDGRDTYVTALGGNPSADNTGLAAPTTDCSVTGACTAAQLAQFDLGRWWASLTGTTVTMADPTNPAIPDPTPPLDKPTVCLCLRPGTFSDFRLTLAWRGSGPAGGFSSEDGVKANLTCGDNEAALYDDPDTAAPDVSLRRTETVRFAFNPVTAGTAPPSGVAVCPAGQ